MNASAPSLLNARLNEALAARSRRDHQALLNASDAALRLDPHNLLGLVLKGDALDGLGDTRSAVSFYGLALNLAQQGRPAPGLIPELRRIHQRQAELAQAVQQALMDGVRARGFDPERSSERFGLSLDLMTGRKQLYHQQPQFYLFPGLPQVQFQPRAETPWLETIEAATPAVLAELQALLSETSLFAPYVEDRANRPASGQAGMLENPDWSAVFLWKDGVEVPEIASRCPATMAALQAAPLDRIPGRSPSILFSKLAAGARIPPHHGMINTRLICHLPLIVPPGCWFRVGSDVRQWEAGRAWAFDDTIEHEAWNESDQDRIILIFDVWKPEITEEERGLVCGLFDAIDKAGVTPPKLGT